MLSQSLGGFFNLFPVLLRFSLESMFDRRGKMGRKRAWGRGGWSCRQTRTVEKNGRRGGGKNVVTHLHNSLWHVPTRLTLHCVAHANLSCFRRFVLPSQLTMLLVESKTAW